MSLYSPRPIWQELDSNGRPYAGGLLYTYENGTTTPKITYDANGAVNTNPVVFDSAGRASIKLDTGSYSMTFTDGVGATVYDPAVVEGVVVWTKDGVGYSDAFGVFTTVDTIAALRALTYASSSFVLVKNYAVAGDNGGGIFYWDSINTSSDDSGVIIKPTGYTGSSGRWHRQFTGNVKVRWFGAQANGLDDSVYFQRAIAYATYYLTGIDLDYGTYTLASDPGFTQSIVVVVGDAIIKWSGFAPTINPLIPISDTRRHFQFGAGETPVFASDSSGAYAEIKNVWMDGLSPGWYQSSLNNSIVSLTNQVNTDQTAMDGRVTTLEGYVGVPGTVTGTIYANLATLLASPTVPSSDAQIRGLVTQGSVALGSSISITSGSATTYSPAIGPTPGVGHRTILATALTKDFNATWVPGNGGGRPTVVTPVNYTWYNVFLIGSSTDSSVADVGFDTSDTATNLLYQAAGFDTYRRIGYVLWMTATIQPFNQVGDNFTWATPAQESIITIGSINLTSIKFRYNPVAACPIGGFAVFALGSSSANSRAVGLMHAGSTIPYRIFNWDNAGAIWGLVNIPYPTIALLDFDNLVTSAAGLFYYQSTKTALTMQVTITNWTDTRGKW